MHEVLLLTPGPTPLHPRAQAALSWPMRSHMDPDVLAYNDRIAADLQRLYCAGKDSFTCLLSGTGSLAMEAGLANLLEVGDRVVVPSNGVFGERIIEMARRLRARVAPVRFPDGAPLDVDSVRAVMARTRPKLVAMVHGETSTGVLNPVERIGELVREAGALFAVDAVTTAGMLRFDMAGWGVDFAYTGSQKCLSGPPGVAPIALSARALSAVKRRKSPVVTWYSDLVSMAGYWRDCAGEARRYHHTVPVQLHWATGEAIRAALDEGVAARAKRVRIVAHAVLCALEQAGFSAFVPHWYRLPTVLAVKLPPGLDDQRVREALRREHRIMVTGGLGSTSGRIWRLGLMGEGARPEHYRRLLNALTGLLGEPSLVSEFDRALKPSRVQRPAQEVTDATAASA